MSLGDDVLEGIAKGEAYQSVVELLDAEIDKAKDRGDLQTAETIETLRAKIKAKFLVGGAP